MQDIREKLRTEKVIGNDFDYTRAKVELKRLAGIYATGCCSVASDAQMLSDAVDEYEKRTMDLLI